MNKPKTINIMCTRTNQEKLKVAEKDITVYKLIEVAPVYKDCFQTPQRRLLDHPEKYTYASYYLGHIINHDCVENKLPYKAKGVAKRGKTYSGLSDYKYSYTGGLIHAFKRKKDAELIIRKGSEYDEASSIVYKCIIPKGTKYAHGVDGNGFDSYASEQIIFDKPAYFTDVTKQWYDKLHQK